jgi:TolA-binding protein
MRPHPDVRLRRLCALGLLALGGCAGTSPPPEPTLKTLKERPLVLAPDRGVKPTDEDTIAAYRDFLKAAPKDAQRPEAMRRLGDLEMDSADNRMANAPEQAAKGAEGQNYGAAVKLYKDLLKEYPNAADNDRVLYQLAHAYELGGQLESALQALDELVNKYPRTPLRDEAQFRRGELLFSIRNYPASEKAYATILNSPTHTPYFERSLYMHGWAQYKQGRLEDSLQSFFGVLDLKLIARDDHAHIDEIPGLTRADRELVEDTLRVTSLCLENLQGADSIPPYMVSPLRRDYEFRVYQQLGELYLQQDRAKDAADTFASFARLHPLDAQAPIMQARVIDIYEKGGFENLVLQAKTEYVERYGIHSEFRRANPEGWARAQPLVKTHLAELARHYHAAAQKSKKSEDYQVAVRWYRELLESFPNDPQAAQANFLLAELLFEDARFAEAAPEYEKAAYHYPPHPHSADAGYAALLAYAEQEKTETPGQRNAVQLASIESAQRFGFAFPKDPRTGPVLANAAEKLYKLREYDKATDVAQRVLKLDPAAAPEQRRVAWSVIAHAAFDSGAYDRAERGYTELLALTAPTDPGRNDLVEALAASVYKQGEQARAKGKAREAVDDFARVAVVAPLSPVRATAQYDAAAALIELKDWPAAARTLEDFRQRFPQNPLQGEVNKKLAVVYSESGQWTQAAGEFERLAQQQTDPELARGALWQAAELHQKAGSGPSAARVYAQYVKRFPVPLEPAIEARYRLAGIAKAQGDDANALAWDRDLLQAEQAGGAGRTERTRFLGATAALALTQPAYAAYRQVALVEPLKKQLALKKARMEEVLKAYATAAEYGVADVATDATFHTAELYHDFGQALMASERPKGLSKDEREQYDVLLEEQAFPFEEKAIALHETNARRTTQGIYDQWVKGSYTALAQLRPLRYGKTERGGEAVDAIR